MKRSKDMFEDIFLLQKQFEERVEPFVNNKFEFSDYQEQERITLDFIDHTIEELIELRRELPVRKSWSSKRDNPPDENKTKEEYIDALHFFVTIAIINGWNAKDIYDAYIKKNNINHIRQDENY